MLPLFDQFCPTLRARDVIEVTPEFLASRGIRAVILDLDNTLVTWHGREVAPPVAEWVRTLQEAGVALCIVSNTHRPGRLRELSAVLGVPFVPSGGKPRRAGFRRAMAAMSATADETAVIGDQLMTDIWGGNRCGLLTIWVDPISEVEWWGTKVIHRSLERILLRRMQERGAEPPFVSAAEPPQARDIP
jgi:uncharacterized protein